MPAIFDTIITKGVRSGQIPARTEDARKWYRDTAMGYKRVDEKTVMKADADRMHNRILPGNMYMFFYDPKYKETLPYYDRFPLIFPFRVENDRFWGINFHYLNLNYRAILMDHLYDLVNNTRYDERTKLRLNYEALNKAAKFRYIKPCVKQYLFSHLQSRFLYVYPSEWDIALFLPTERFQKSTKRNVQQQSSMIIREASTQSV